MFNDTPEGAEASALLYSLLVTAKTNGINPHQWLLFALDGIANGIDPLKLLPYDN